MEDLNFYLQKIKWLEKGPLYSLYIDRVTLQKEVKNPKISVVVISNSFNSRIIENFKSLDNQHHNNFELIFVNNGKGDGEFSSILQYVNIYINLNIDTGAYKARNIGAVYAQAPILLFLDDDGIADKHFLESHLKAYDNYKVISVRGVCKPLTNNVYNNLVRHYYLGNKPFPMFVNLEGNASYDSNSFYSVGGWSDEINFGYGGKELSLRLTAKYPNKALQIYSPKPVIFHDYVKNEEHFVIKKHKQEQSLEALKQKYPNWDEFFKSWEPYSGKFYLVEQKAFIYSLRNYCFFLLVEHVLPQIERHLPRVKRLKTLIRSKVFRQ